MLTAPRNLSTLETRRIKNGYSTPVTVAMEWCGCCTSLSPQRVFIATVRTYEYGNWYGSYSEVCRSSNLPTAKWYARQIVLFPSHRVRDREPTSVRQSQLRLCYHVNRVSHPVRIHRTVTYQYWDTNRLSFLDFSFYFLPF